MASIYKRGKIYWIEYRVDGLRKQVSTKQTDRKIAENLRKHYESLEKASFLKGTRLYRLNFSDFCEEYLATRKIVVAKKTYQKDIIALKSLSQFIPEYQQVSDIDTEIIKKWYLDKAKQTSATNANSLLRHISKFFTTAIKSRYIAQNPCQYVEKCKENEPIVKTLSQSEVKHLLDYFHDNDKELHTITMIVLNTGIRVSELCRLKVNDISTENGTMIVRSENDRPTKSKKYRVVPIPQHALTFFKDLTNNRLQEELLLQWRSEWLSKKFVKKARQAGINCGLHDLRRTYGAWLVMAGCDLVTVQQNMGHSSIHVTVKHYAHISLNQRIEQTNKLPDVGKT